MYTESKYRRFKAGEGTPQRWDDLSELPSSVLYINDRKVFLHGVVHGNPEDVGYNSL